MRKPKPPVSVSAAPASKQREAPVSGFELTAVAANDLWKKRHTMTVQEQRLLVWLISQVEPFQAREFSPVTLTVQEFAAAIGHEGGISGSLYDHMQTVTKAILARPIYISKPDGGWRGFNWLLVAEYTPGTGTMLLQLHPFLSPYILNLKERFAKVDVGQLMQLRGNYSISFYEYCCAQNYGSRQWTMTVEEMRSWLNIPDGEIPRVRDLKKIAIVKAKEELDRRCRISFTFKDLKTSRSITGWMFTVVDNVPTAPRGGMKALPAPSPSAPVPPPAAPVTPPFTEEELQEQREAIAELKAKLLAGVHPSKKL